MDRACGRGVHPSIYLHGAHVVDGQHAQEAALRLSCHGRKTVQATSNPPLFWQVSCPHHELLYADDDDRDVHEDWVGLCCHEQAPDELKEDVEGHHAAALDDWALV